MRDISECDQIPNETFAASHIAWKGQLTQNLTASGHKSVRGANLYINVCGVCEYHDLKLNARCEPRFFKLKNGLMRNSVYVGSYSCLWELKNSGSGER